MIGTAGRVAGIDGRTGGQKRMVGRGANQSTEPRFYISQVASTWAESAVRGVTNEVVAGRGNDTVTVGAAAGSVTAQDAVLYRDSTISITVAVDTATRSPASVVGDGAAVLGRGRTGVLGPIRLERPQSMVR